ncbi:MAG: alpha/beta hydrolase [Planctomycetia bacterium]|nr:alpha/beta hydrolase [Planctomycetia bacterium]
MMAPAAAETIRLWQGDAPGSRGTADQDIPVIAWWPAPKSATPVAALVICPGGGYGGLADHEGSDYAKWLNTQGISAFVLRYRLGSKGYRHPVMLGDVSRAIRLVRHDHERLGIDPKRVGVMGSSAGGHLALTACIHGGPGEPAAPDAVDRVSARPDLGVLCYPVVSMLPEKTHSGSRKNLLGDTPSDELSRELSGELAAHDNTPPLFVWHTWEDKAVKLEPILELGLRLKSLGRPYELHVYETGPHGLGLGVRPYDGMKQLHPWTVECRRWLGAQGF